MAVKSIFSYELIDNKIPLTADSNMFNGFRLDFTTEGNTLTYNVQK